MNRIKYLGLLFVLYLILPVLVGLIMFLMGIQYVDESGPAGGMQLLIWSGVPLYLAILTFILLFIFVFIIPALYLIGGILFYKMNNKGRKLLIISMIISIISKISLIVLGLMHEQIKIIFTKQAEGSIV